MAAPQVTTDTIAANDNSTLLIVNMTNVTKLTASNYLMWSRQVHALLDGYNLSGFLDGSSPAPAPTITTNEVVSPNPKYTFWKRQDKLVFSALLGSITVSIQPLLSTTNTSAEIWKKLADTYAMPSRGHIKQVKQAIKNWSKGEKSIHEYVHGFITRFDELALLGKPLDHDDKLEYILAGLPEDYRSIKDQLEGRDVAPSLTEVHEKLLNKEADLLSSTSNAFVHPVTANAANVRHQQNSRGHSRFSNSSNHNTNNASRGTQSWQHTSNRPRGYQGHCQICGIHGHSARTCSQLHSQPAPFGHRSNAPPATSWQPQANIAAAQPHYSPQTIAAAQAQSSPQWILDSGATHHLTTDLHNLALHQPYNGGEDVTIADGTAIPISHTGSTSLTTLSKPLILSNVLYVPNLHKNLLSVYRLCNANHVTVQFYPGYFQVIDLRTGALLIRGNTRHELYEWPAIHHPTALSATPTPKTTLSSWHSRLGHPSSSILNTLVSRFSLPCLTSKQSPCTHCLINKSHQLPFSTNTVSSTKPLQIIYSDVWMSPVLSHDNSRYYVVFVDHYTRYTWLYPLTSKAQVKDTFILFKALVEKHFQTHIHTLYTDNGGEFIALRNFLAMHGISHHTSPPHTPQHNGISERKHRHIVETGLTLLHQASVPKSYWPFAFATAVYLINRQITPSLDGDSPYHKLFQRNPNYLKLRVFGSLCFPWLRPYTKHKLDDRSLPCVFLGYSLTQSAYLCLHKSTGRIYVSRHVQFDEQTFPFAETSLPVTTTPAESDQFHNPTTPPHSTLQLQPLVPARSSAPPLLVYHRRGKTVPSVPPPAATQPPMNSGMNSLTQVTNTSTTTLRPTSPPPSTTEHTSQPIPPQPQPAQSLTTNHHPMETRLKAKQNKPQTHLTVATPDTHTHAHKHGQTSSKPISPSVPIIPKTAHQALRDPKWRSAMSDEHNAQLRNHTYELVPPNPSQHVISTKWIFTIKYRPNGLIDRYKARWVARGFTQEYGVDYAETFSPVVKSVTIRLILQLAVARNWKILQLDVNNAFLHGTLKDEVYVAQPMGFIDEDRPHYVCRLKKALYGLKQAPRAWYQELKSALISYGFRNSLADTSVFIYTKSESIVYLLVYVDDIVITGSHHSEIDSCIRMLADRFSLKEPTPLTYFLGIEVTPTPAGLHLSQRKYVLDLLDKTNMRDAKPVTTPMSTAKLTLTDGTALDSPAEYRMVVGSLQYLAFTRPDIAFVVNRLSQFMSRPTDVHWAAAKRVLRYLAGTAAHGLTLRKNNPLVLHAFSDADWAGDTDDFVSTNAYILYLGSTPIAWSSKKQKGVARSSTEAEYRSVANTAAELKWVCSLLTELGVHLKTPPVIYCDNVGATYLCANPVFHSRMKHLALDFHFVRETIQSGALRVTHVSTKDQLADALTKPLPRSRFAELFRKIGVATATPS